MEEERSSAVDLDSLLLSHGEFDSDEEPDRHHRTVDEILLNHSSSSPSPPSSPSTSYSSTSLLHSHTYNTTNTNTDCSTNTTKYVGRVLPQLFSSGVSRSSAKPGAALAAAAAASRSIPTPHATAIKLRRATTAILQSSVSETVEENNVSTHDSSSLSPSPIGVSIVSPKKTSDAITYVEGSGFSPLHEEEEEGVKLEQFPSNKSINFDSVDNALWEYSVEHRLQENSYKVAEDEDGTPSAVNDEECRMPVFESASPVEKDKDVILDDINVNEQISPPLLNEKTDDCPEVGPADESGQNNRMVAPPPILNDVDNECTTAGEGSIDFGNVQAEDRGDDDASTQTDLVDVHEDLVALAENKMDHTNFQEKSPSLLKPLDLAEEIEKKQAFTALHYEEGAAAQPMRLEGTQRGSTVLGYFDIDSNNAITRIITSQAFRRDHGSPQVVSVHFNYIAVGMSKGSIFVVPSKYTAHHVDNMDAKMTSLGLQGDRSYVPVTSMCFNQQGDLLFAGYGDGHYTVWDVQKASALKVITEHKAPVVHMLYLGQDTQVTRQFNVVSGDSKGVVKLIRFSVVPWLNRISYTKSMKLLDETTSRVVCASPLLYGDSQGGTMMSSQSSNAVSASSISSMMGGMVDEGVVIFITHQSALVAKVSPNVEVYAQIPKPDGVREGAMPYAAWRCMSQSLGSSAENAPVETSDKVSLLAIAWDQKVQIAELLKSELKVIEKWTLESTAIGLAWLGDQMLAILTSTAQLYLFAKDGNLIHQTSFSMDGFQGDGLISHHIYFSNALGNPEKAYQNSVAVRGATIYILGQEHLIVSRLLSWKERIEVLRKAGDWIGALNMAMKLYDGQTHGVIDLPKNLDGIQRSVMPYLVELLHSYVNEVFSYISVACYNQHSKLDELDEIKEQYTRVGGVAVEFCVHIRRTDILFDDILSKFDDADHKETFLELLEPYILKDMLGSLPPAVYSTF